MFRLRIILALTSALIAPLGGAPVARVVSQTVGADELLLAVARPEQIAALSHLARDPAFSAVTEAAKGFAQISLGDAEAILKFEPTLVLFADYSRPELVAQVRRSGVNVIIFDRYKTMEDVYASLRQLAAELGTLEKAERVVADCERRLAALRERLRDVKPVKVIAPSTYGVIPGCETTFQDLCDYAGAENLGATLGGLRGHERTPAEAMLTWPVERVVIAGDDIETALATYRTLPPYQFMAVVKEGRAVLVKPWQMGCVSHRRVEAYEQLARALHPEAFVR